MVNLFVYGTLKKGGCNHGILEKQKTLGCGHTIDEFCMYDLGPFPYVTAERVSYIHGEVYRVDEETMKEIDEIEGPEYRRFKTNVLTYDYGIISAWMYVLDFEEKIEGSLVRSGDWLINNA